MQLVMSDQRTQPLIIAALFAASVLISFAVLNRWLVTDLGVLSYGRVWQLYISYEDFGFVRRALVGTTLSVTGLNEVTGNEYHFAIAFHHLLLLTLSAIIFRHIVRSGLQDIPLIATVVLSPALIIHSGYTTGSLDIVVLILAALNILYVRRAIPFLCILVVGIFVHELSLFTVPAQLAAYTLRERAQRGEFPTGFFFLAGASVAASLIVVVIFGATDLPRAVVDAVMAAKIPNAAQNHSLWSGYLEISSSAAENAAGSMSILMREMTVSAPFLALPVLYALLVAARLFLYARDSYEKLLLTSAALFPFMAAFVATDLYRWIGLSAGIGLLLTLSLLEQRKETGSTLTYALLPFTLTAPLGAAQLDWPFPVIQFISERLLSAV